MAVEINSQEKENRRIALIITSVLYIALLMICFLWIIMSIPNPLPSQIAEGGIEVSYGFDNQGSGEVESYAPPNTNRPNPDARQGNPPVDPRPQPQSAPPAPPQPAPKADDDDDAVVTTDDEKAEEIKTRPEPKKEEPRKKTVTETPTKKPVETPPKPATPTPPAPKVAEAPKPQVDQRALFKKTDKTGAGGVGNGSSDRLAGNNNGDDVGKVGDKGDPRGIMGSKNYSGTPGSGGGNAGGIGTGVNSNIRGWNARIRQPNPDELESDGFVVFNIEIDEDGKLKAVTTKESTLSPVDVAVCKRYVQSGTYTAKDGNEGGGVGTVRFTIRSR